MAWEGFQRIGHGGASALAPANTLASFDAAVAVGIDMVEFDVRERRGELVLAHTTFHAARGGNALLGDALAHLRKARSTPASAPRPNSGRTVLARSLEVASTRAAVIPPAVAPPVSDEAVGFRRCRPAGLPV